MPIQKLTVLGSGTMGSGIAQTAAQAGFDTVLHDVSKEILDRALAGIERRLDRAVGKGRLTKDQAETARSRLICTADFRQAVEAADAVIEAVPEKLELKREVFSKVEGAAPAHCLLGTNTSTIMISALAEALEDRSRLVGVHFFNPVPVMKLIEVVMGPDTSEESYSKALEIAGRMGKETVRVKESPGFATSRINALIGNEAFRMLEEGVASAADIDKALKLGLNHPMGPFQMVDLVGLDARLNNLRYLHEHLGETYRPSPLLERLVAAGRLGRKTGRGVYRYGEDGSRLDEGEDLP